MTAAAVRVKFQVLWIDHEHVVFQVDDPAMVMDLSSVLDPIQIANIGQGLRRQGRAADAFGRLDTNRFAVIAPGASVNFTIRLSTSVVGTYSGQVAILTNDADERPFDFRILGTVITPLV